MSETVILFGGSSSERLVSVASAQNVSRVLGEAAAWFLGAAGEVTEISPSALAAHAEPFTRPFEPNGRRVGATLAAALDSVVGRDVAFFLALHGGEGEDGTVQRQLESRRLAFTGSGSVASANAFDKVKAKQLAGARGTKVAEARTLSPMTRSEAERTLKELLEVQPRWVLKPRADGSSHGLFHLRGLEDVAQGSDLLAQLSLPYLAEVFVGGRELTVGVVDDEAGAVALPVSEVRVVKDGSFDYEGKYLGRGTEELTPADLETSEREAAQTLAVVTHRAVGCAGYSRTDMILTPAGPVLLEINTLPGLTKASFIPQQLAAAGRELRAFLEWQLVLARRRRDSGA